MITTLRGRIQSFHPEGIVLDVGGVGYHLTMSSKSVAGLGEPLDEAFIYTHMHVREDAMSLFGFVEPEERAFFQILTGVSGVGPKVAIAILSAYTPDDLRRAVLNKDIALFQSISGIGKKTAERLVLELKDKVGEIETQVPGGTPAGEGSYYLAREALIGLGFSLAEAEAALSGADEDQSVEELVREALKKTGSTRS
jgi:Holliday junction DNA helicase RuvA